MGASFTNLHVRRTTPQEICTALPKIASRRAYVSPKSGDWVTIYTEVTEDQNSATIHAIGTELSGALKTEVLSFLVHDSDIAVYWLFRNGKLVDEFNSAPDYFRERLSQKERDRVRGNSHVLLPLCAPGTTRGQLEEVLHPAVGYPLMAEDIVINLASLLGIDEMRVGLGFEYFEAEGQELLPDIAQFEPVGKGAERKEARSPAPDGFAGAVPDTYPLAINMMAQIWNEKLSKEFESAPLNFGIDKDAMLRQMRNQFDKFSSDLLKKSALPNIPTIGELKSARDQGPDALAALIVKRTPDQLTGIGISTASNGLEPFLAALLKHGLDPNSADQDGLTTLIAAAQHGMDSSIYRMVQAATGQSPD